MHRAVAPVLTSSSRQLGAALAASGGEDRTTGAGTHPEAEAMGAAAAPVARLERALAHGTTPQGRRLNRDRTPPRRSRPTPGRHPANAGDSDLLTVRGAVHVVKPAQLRPHGTYGALSSRHAGTRSVTFPSPLRGPQILGSVADRLTLPPSCRIAAPEERCSDRCPPACTHAVDNSGTWEDVSSICSHVTPIRRPCHPLIGGHGSCAAVGMPRKTQRRSSERSL